MGIDVKIRSAAPAGSGGPACCYAGLEPEHADAPLLNVFRQKSCPVDDSQHIDLIRLYPVNNAIWFFDKQKGNKRTKGDNKRGQVDND